MAIVSAELGTVSHGTLLDSDLMNAFLTELEFQLNRQKSAEPLTQEDIIECDRLRGILAQGEELQTRCEAMEWELDDETQEEVSEAINETLMNALETFSPEFAYFGTHPGDGSDFGYWRSDDAIRDAIHDGNMVDVGSCLPDFLRVVSDHGNETIYRIVKTEEV